jgi:hypothetical protein
VRKDRQTEAVFLYAFTERVIEIQISNALLRINLAVQTHIKFKLQSKTLKFGTIVTFTSFNTPVNLFSTKEDSVT